MPTITLDGAAMLALVTAIMGPLSAMIGLLYRNAMDAKNAEIAAAKQNSAAQTATAEKTAEDSRAERDLYRGLFLEAIRIGQANAGVAETATTLLEQTHRKRGT